MTEKTWVEISKQNILDNIKSIKYLLEPQTKFMAVLKSNAYGHGLLEVSKICAKSNEVSWFGVDSIDEALALRQIHIKMPILVLGYVPFERVKEAGKNNISIVAYNKKLFDYVKNFELKVHIKIETGTSRQGIANEELVSFVREAQKNPNILIEGIYTHYANIEDTTDPSYAFAQLKKFEENIKQLEKVGINIAIKHSACSAAIINYKETHFDMARAGISLYGMWPSSETKAIAIQKNIKLKLKPAITWKTKIAQIKKLKEGTPISYGLTERVKRNSRIAVLPIGYWDGYDRGLSSVGEVLIHKKRAKVLGRVCMNMTVVDVTDITEARIHDDVILLGNDITAEEMAQKLGTINYEIVTRINPIIKRIII